MKSLVIFYSLEGNTKLIATTIANTINADILELKTKKTYAGKKLTKYFWGGRDVLFNSKPELEKIDKDINDYETIFIGTPIWVGTYAPPFNTFLNDYKIENKNIALFACHGGGGVSRFYTNIKKKIPNNNFIGEIDFFDPLTNNKEESIEKVKAWIKELIK